MTEGVFGLGDFERLARDRLDDAAYAYIAGGAGDEVTLAENVAAFRRYRLRPRVMVDVSGIDPSTTFLGTPVPMPVGLAPNAGQKLAHPEGEVATARAAADAGVLMCLSTLSSCSMEEVAAAGDGPRWFQLYVHPDAGITRTFIERAVAAGYRAIVVTVDLPMVGHRERELRHPVTVGDDGGTPLGNFAALDLPAGSLTDVLQGTINASLTWDDLAEVRSQAGIPVLVKGVLTGEDARLAVEAGADGIVVSNHGGRQLDRTIASIDALEEVVQAAGGRAEVYLDSGVRRGTDVVTALALGARGVFIGRPYLYALALDGSEGVSRALALMHAEVTNALGLLGCRTPNEVTRSHVLAP